ncbi:MAG: hypothetical protein ACW98K_13950 [Candidatus Kariarchaeaceae archaeon]|jgi:hypothetical protein
MMYLSLIFGRSVLRWLNIILGLILGLLNLYDFVGAVSSIEPIGVPRAIMIALMAIVPFLKAWHAWKWPKEEESTYKRQKLVCNFTSIHIFRIISSHLKNVRVALVWEY